MLGFLSLLFSFSLLAECSFKPEIKSVYSFSGPVTLALKDLGFLKSSVMKGVSVFNPLEAKDFSGEVFPGGIFLSTQSVQKLKGSVVFFDESRELAKFIQGFELKTRGLEPLAVSQLVVEMIRPHLQNCSVELDAWLRKSSDLAQNLRTLIPHSHNVIFYLGEFSRGRAPDLVIANDGVVKFLKNNKSIETYPSDLAYVNWSAQIIGKMPKDTLKIYVKDSAREFSKSVKRLGSHEVAFDYPGSLVPGKSQLEAWTYLYQELKREE